MAQKLKVRDVGRRRRRLLIVAAVFALLLLTVYFALTSATFVRQYVLPRVGQLLGAEITVADTSIQPLSRVELKQLRVQVAGREPLLEIGEVRARYSLFAILGGRIKVDELTVVGAKLNVIETTAGNNLPALFNKPPGKAKGPSAVSFTPKLEIQNVAITGAQLRHARTDQSGATATVTVSEFDLKLDRLQNGQPGKLSVSSVTRLDQTPGGAGTNSFVLSRSSGEIEFTLNEKLQPASIKGSSTHAVVEAGGGLRDLAGLTGTSTLELAPTELTQFSVSFDQRGQRLGEVRVSGPLDLKKSEGQLRFELSSIGHQVLNLLGARQGLDFQQSALGASGLVSLSQGGKVVSGEGRLQGRRLAVKQVAGATPPVDLDFAWEFRANATAEQVTLQKLQLTATQGGNEILSGKLDYPMEVSWAKTAAKSFTKSTLTLNLRQIDLGEWRALHGQTNLAGKLAADLALTATPGAQRLQLALNSAVAGFVLGNARQSQLQAQFTAAYSVKDADHLVAGKASVANPAGTAADLWPRGLRSGLDFDVASGPEEVALRRALVTFASDTGAGGTVELGGRFSPKRQQGDLSVKLDALNQHALGPFLATALAPRQLTSAALDGSATVKLDAKRQSTVDAELTLANFVLTTPGAGASAPLGATVKLSAASGNEVHELKRALLALTPTDRAKNELQIAGRFDLRRANPEPSRLTVMADALDLTPLWDAFAPPTKPAPAAPAPKPSPAPPAPAPAPRTEPEPVKLPVKQFTLDANLGRVYARQIAITNFVTTARLHDGLLAVKPLEFTLNGAPVAGLLDMNLGVRGWLYDLDLALARVRLQPLMDSVSPGTAGTYNGELNLTTTLKGAGVTDESLRTKLNGDVNLTLTNASIQLAQGWKQGVLAVVATLLRVPELTQAPVAWANASVKIGGGQVQLPAARVGSEAFIAGLSGTIPLAPVLTNSPLDLPVKLELRRTLAQKAGLGVGGPPDAEFAALPDFLRIQGTVGAPKAEINKLALGGVLLQSLGGIPGVAGGKSGAILQGIGGLLTGQQPAVATTNTTGTNAPGTNKPAPLNPFDLLKRKK